MRPSKIIPFKDFYEQLHTARHKELQENAYFAVRSPEHFEEMRHHLLEYYQRVEVVHSFMDHTGQVWDCIPVDKQPAARDGLPIAKPRVIPGRHPKSSSNRLHQSIFARGDKDDEGNERSCPQGCIPLRRLSLTELTQYQTLQDFFKKTPDRKISTPVADQAAAPDKFTHLHAHGYQWINNLGGRSTINIWDPVVNGQDEVFSLSQHWYVAGQGGQLQTVEAGWQVWAANYGAAEPCLFTFWTADNYGSTGAYNGTDGKFKQQSNLWAPGQPLPVSADGGTQAEIDVCWFLQDGNWCLYINGIDAVNQVGYYPATVYNGGPMATGAEIIDYGGEVCALQEMPPMGSGALPAAGYQHAAYQRNIYCFTADGSNPDATLEPDEEAPGCFQISIQNNAGWGEFFYFGGPGGGNCQQAPPASFADRVHFAFRNSKNKTLIQKYHYFKKMISIYASMEDNTKSISDRVKIAILFENGDSDPDPTTLADTTTQMSVYNFDAGDYGNITDYFNHIIVAVKPGAKTLNTLTVQAYTTVQDCIDGVNAAVK